MKKDLGVNSALYFQSVDYKYGIQGNLLAINLDESGEGEPIDVYFPSNFFMTSKMMFGNSPRLKMV